MISQWFILLVPLAFLGGWLTSNARDFNDGWDACREHFLEVVADVVASQGKDKP